MKKIWNFGIELAQTRVLPKNILFSKNKKFVNNKKRLWIKARKMMTEINWVQNQRNSENLKKITRAVPLERDTNIFFGKCL